MHVIFAAAVLGAFVGQAMRVGRTLSFSVPAEPRRVNNWEELRSAGHVRGERTAPLQIVHFSDYECPACKILHDRVNRLEQRHRGRVAITFLHFPIEQLHPNATAAAIASECAAEQARFNEFSDHLFGSQELIGIQPWETVAQAAGVPDIDAFRDCLAGSTSSQRVHRQRQMGDRLGVTATRR